MKKLLLFIAIAFIGMKGLAQAPRPTISGLSSVQNYASPSTARDAYFTIAANGADATSYIQVSTSAATIGSATSYSAGFTNATFSNSLDFLISSLQPGTTYYWRIWSNNAFGTTYGPVNSFTTASTPVLSAISSITGYNSAAINYTLNASGLATTSVINYGLTASSLSNQINGISATGTTPASGIGNITGLLPSTTYYYQIVATNASGTTTSTTNSFTTTAQTPIISSASLTNTSANSSTINYSLNANNLTTTSVINYGTSSSALTNQINGGSASGSLDTAVSIVVSGLNTGTTYYYQIVATNSAGSTNSAILSLTPTDPSAIAQYNFDNTYSNILGNTPFNSATNTTFISDRNGQAQKALRLNGYISNASIANLPTGNAARSVSIWAIIPTASIDTRICFYGSLSSNQSYGISVQSNNLLNFGYANDLVAASSGFSGNVWAHIVTTFDGTTARIYKNGIEVASGNKSTWNTANNGLFYLGGSNNIAVDDLKIYNRVLTQAEITSLYNNNSILSSQSYNSQNLKATIYPNPTSDNFTIEMENEVKSVEVYSIQGQTVMISNSKNIDVSNLSKGMYLVRIEDENNAVATQKLIIK